MVVRDDLDLVLQDFGVPVAAAGSTGIGILDHNSELLIDGQAVVADYVLTCRTDQFGALRYGDPITVDGAAYKVEHAPIRHYDGLLCGIPLILG